MHIWFNTSLRQLNLEADGSYKNDLPAHPALPASGGRASTTSGNPIEIDELYVKVGPKGRERDGPLRSRGLSTRGDEIYIKDKLPVFILVDRGSADRYVIPANVRLNQRFDSCWRSAIKSRWPSTDSFRAYVLLNEDDAFGRKYVVHDDGEYVDGDVHVNPYESSV
jgi:transposase